MYQLNIHINSNPQKSFINTFAAINAVIIFANIVDIPIVYYSFGQLEYLSSPMPIVTYVFMIFVRIFFMSQLLLACSAVKSRFHLFNDAFSQKFLLNRLEPLCVQESDLKCYGFIFHQLCDGIEMINQSFTFQLIPLMPHILVTLPAHWHRNKIIFDILLISVSMRHGVVQYCRRTVKAH